MENIQSSGYATFDVGAYRFKAYPRPIVLRMAPYIRTNEDDEESAYAMLLLYVPWPREGEEYLLRGEASAVAAFQVLKTANKLPMHVLTQIDTFKKSEDILNDMGDAVYAGQEIESDNEEVEHSGDDDGSISGDSQCEEGDIMGELEDSMRDITVAHSGESSIDCAVGDDGELMQPESLLNESNDVKDVAIINRAQCMYFTQYIKEQIAICLTKYMQENTTCNTQSNSLNGNTSNMLQGNKIPVENEAERCAEFRERRERLTIDQAGAINTIEPCIKNPAQNDGMIQYVSGGAGVGKSEYIKCSTEMTRLHYGKQPGRYGSVLILAPTGCSARNVSGYTWQSALGKGRNEKNQKDQYSFLKQQKAEEVYSHIKGVKLIIIDEISMVSLESLHEISRRICEAICTSVPDPKERSSINSKPFGGITTILCGDLYQLSCVGGTPIYSTGKLNKNAVAGQKIWRSIRSYHNFTRVLVSRR